LAIPITFAFAILARLPVDHETAVAGMAFHAILDFID
jgi:hypothetical protein